MLLSVNKDHTMTHRIQGIQLGITKGFRSGGIAPRVRDSLPLCLRLIGDSGGLTPADQGGLFPFFPCSYAPSIGPYRADARMAPTLYRQICCFIAHRPAFRKARAPGPPHRGGSEARWSRGCRSASGSAHSSQRRPAPPYTG